MVLLDPDKVKWIILHCSASHYGDVDTIQRWHLDRGWSGIGYHWVVTNSYPTYNHYHNKKPDPNFDGLIHAGRSERFRGAHVSNHNWESVGVCLIGMGGEFSSKQLISVAKLCFEISSRFPKAIGVKGHYEFTNVKTCPEIDMSYFRTYLLELGVPNEEPVQPMFDPTILVNNGGV